LQQLSVVQDYILQSIRHHHVIKPVGTQGTVWAGIDFAPEVGVIGANQSEAVRELYAALEGWVLSRLTQGDSVPVVQGIDLNTDEGHRLAAWHEGQERTRDPDQAWFWSPKWQAGELEADQDIANGRTRVFDGDDAFLASIREAKQDLSGAKDGDKHEGDDWL
jgi:hypothetical protein